MTFNIDSTSTIPANTTSLILQNVLVGITPSNLNGTVTISSKSYTWYLVAQASSSPTTYDLNIKLTSVLTGYRTNAIDLAFTQTNNNLSVSSLNFNNTTYSITNTGDISANSLAIGSSNITNTGAITGTSLNLGSTGTITSGQINSSYVVQSYPITSTNATPANTFLGTFVSSQNGSSINVKVISHSGSTGSNSQDFSIDIYFKTADSITGTLIGTFGGNGYHILYDNKFNTNLRDYSTFNIYWVANAAGVNATNFSLYMYNGNYNNNSIYTVTYSNGSSWSTSIQNASPNPPANTSTCLLSTLISPLSSSASNTDVTFKAITGSSVSLGTASGNTVTAGALKIGSSYGITNAGDISGNKMNAGAITGTSLNIGTTSGNTVTAGNLVVGASSGITNAGAITGTSVSLGTASTNTITAGNLAVSSSNYGISNAGTITGTSVSVGTASTNTITAGNLAVGASSGITNAGAITGTSLNVGTGTITSGQINSNYVVQSYPIPSTNATTGNLFLGTFVSSQNGSGVNVKIVSHAGFNALNSQDFSIDVYFKTGDGLLVDGLNPSGFPGNAYHIMFDNNFNTNLLSYTYANLFWVANAGGLSATNYSLYLYGANYNNNSFYTVTYSNGCSWSTSIQNASPNPPANSSTCLLSTLISPLSSSASNTDVTFKGISGTSVSLGTGTNKTIINDNFISIGKTRDPAFALDVSGRFLCTFNRDNNFSKFFTMQQYIATGTTGAYLDTQGGLNLSWNVLSHSDGTNPGTGTYLGSGMTEFTNYAGYGAKGTYSDSKGGFSFWTAIATSGTTSSTYLANINAGSIYCPGTITCGRVNSNFVTQTYPIANTNSGNGNLFLGTFVCGQNGSSVNVKVFSHIGTNGYNGQDYSIDINFKTSNGDSSNTNGTGFMGNGYHILYDNLFNTNLVNYNNPNIYWVANASGNSPTSFSLYMFHGTFNTNSFYTVTYSTICSWTTSTQNTSPTPPANSSTCLLSTLITPLSSSASNTDVNFGKVSCKSINIIQSGTVTGTGASSTVTFANAFSVTPKITFSCPIGDGTHLYIPCISNKSTTGFTFTPFVLTITNGSSFITTNGTYTADWIAYGPTT
jgi:hypothetical protein